MSKARLLEIASLTRDIILLDSDIDISQGNVMHPLTPTHTQPLPGRVVETYGLGATSAAHYEKGPSWKSTSNSKISYSFI